MVPKNSLGFKSIGVVSAINMDGEVLSIKMAEKSIKKPDFIEFMDLLCIYLKPGKAYLFLDNLRMHHS